MFLFIHVAFFDFCYVAFFDLCYGCNNARTSKILSIICSSLLRAGLGRYGDPVHPDGDLLAMRTAMCMLRPGGLLFLSVPVGPDVVVWNLHRRYGEVRLPHLLYGWDVLDVVGWNQEKLTADANWRRSYEPIFVLRAPAARDEL